MLESISGRHVVERAGVRIALLGLQADVDGDRPEVLQRDAGDAHALADRQHLLLVDVELHVDRHELHDGRELGRPVGADHGAGIDEARRDAAVERRDDGRVGEVALGLRDLALGLRERRQRRVALGAGFIDLGDRHRGRLHEILLALQVGVGLQEQRFLLRLRRLRDLQGDLEVLLVDLEEQVALLDRGAVLVADLVEEALHAGHEIDVVERRRAAGHLHVESDLALLRLGDGDLGGRRRLIGVALAAGGEQQRNGDADEAGRKVESNARIGEFSVKGQIIAPALTYRNAA